MTDTLTPAPYARVGDLIQTQKGQIFRVTKVKQVNYGVVDEDGKEWNLRKSGAFMAPASTVFSGPDSPRRAAVASPRPVQPMMHPGTVVFITSGKFSSTTQKYVILRDNGDTVSMTKLNAADGSRYIRGCHKSFLKVTTAS